MTTKKVDWFKVGVAMALTAMAFFLLGLFNTARAADKTLQWTHATQNTDGTPIATILRTEINYGKCNAAKTALAATPAPVIAQVPFPAATHTITGLGTGSWCFQARTVVTGGVTSAYTAFVSSDVLAPVPNPPGGLTVTATVAYTVLKAEDRFVMLPVGTVPADTVCDPTQSVNGYYAVPRAAVTWSGTVRPAVVVAQCT